MNILVIHNEILPSARADEADVLDQFELVRTGLERGGHVIERFACSMDLAELESRLRTNPPDLVFNLVEALGSYASLAHSVPAMVEAMAIPYTGCPTVALCCSSHKPMAKRILAAAGLPTPLWLEDETGSETQEFLPGRYIRKHVWEHASVGMDETSICDAQTREKLISHIRMPANGPWFAEQFIHGREFNLALLENAGGGVEVLPVAEILFLGYAPEQAQIVDYAAKWEPDSFAYNNTPRTFDFPKSDAALVNHLRQLAGAAWQVFRLRGYARVDFRVDPIGQAWILEVNANPCIAPDAGFMAAVERAGYSAADLVERIVQSALPPSAGSTERSRTKPMESKKRDTEGTLRDDVLQTDIQAVRGLTEGVGVFQEHEIVVAVELVETRLRDGLIKSGYHFLFYEIAGEMAAYAIYGEIPCTRGRWDLYWIVVHRDFQGQGYGRILLRAVEQQIHRRGGQGVYVETSSRPSYAPARGFYEGAGYKQEGLLRDFYGPGDGKVIYYRRLG